MQWIRSLSRDKSGREVVLNPHPLLAPRLRMGWSYTSASLLCLHRHVVGVTFNFTHLLGWSRSWSGCFGEGGKLLSFIQGLSRMMLFILTSWTLLPRRKNLILKVKRSRRQNIISGYIKTKFSASYERRQGDGNIYVIGSRWWSVVSLTPWPLYPRGRSFRYWMKQDNYEGDFIWAYSSRSSVQVLK